MPVTYRIDTTKRVIYTQCIGNVTLDEVYDHFRQLKRDPGCLERMDVLLDLSETASIPDSQQIRDVSDQIGRIHQAVRFDACAIVAVSDVLFGMSRMLEVFAEDWFRATHVCRARADAEAWLTSRSALINQRSSEAV
jgi:hypothetical protein